MATGKQPVVIKRYAGRRLYHTAKAAYVELEDLACMVEDGDEFVVRESKTGEDVTRSVLARIIIEQRN
jgi:polyhydroxyalkanoate synthesis repressor PhaR